jgi:alpha-tubulin suppressor-like RCC1 family protein
VTTDHRAYCWGLNEHGQLGDGTTTTRLRPVAVAGGQLFSGVSPAGAHTCGVTTVKKAYCWGWNLYGQLGNGTFTQRLSPIAVAGGLLFSSVGGGVASLHTCGVTTSRAAYCWGGNFDGQLGDGTTTHHPVPVAVVGPM